MLGLQDGKLQGRAGGQGGKGRPPGLCTPGATCARLEVAGESQGCGVAALGWAVYSWEGEPGGAGSLSAAAWPLPSWPVG